MSFLVQEKIKYSAHSHCESWLHLSQALRGGFFCIGWGTIQPVSKARCLVYFWLRLLVSCMHGPIPPTGPTPKPTISCFLVLLLTVWGGFEGLINSSEQKFSGISYYCKQLVPSWDHSHTVPPLVQTYQQDHQSPSTGQHRAQEISVLIMITVISSGHSTLAT